MSGRIEILQKFEAQFIRKDIPNFEVGDTIKMKIKVPEADKVRLHPWEGLVIAKRGTGIKRTFTVRKNSFGEGVEKIFPLHSPVIASIKVVSRGEIKRSKLFYLRHKTGKGARINTNIVTDAEQAAQAAAQAVQVAATA
ncbi:MAG: 50S ribosomal protein L19 [Candidatus Omnitrophica bacterium]|nr:50S ribosomal protein L19 [Candidatus Omnitrophota bacterium]